MPRKRTTNSGRSTAARRKKAQIPDGSEGENLSKVDRESKLEVFISDFQRELQKREVAIRRLVDDKCTWMQRANSIKLMQLPAYIKKMRVNEWLELGGSFDLVQPVEPPDDIPNLQTVLENEEEKDAIGRLPQMQVVKQTTTRKRAAMAGRCKENTADAPGPPPSASNGFRRPSRASSRSRQTPLSNTSYNRLGLETPLVTPKFDPRLPITPATGRPAMPHDVLMSIRGSPVYLDNEPVCPATAIKLPAGTNKTVTIDYTRDINRSYMTQLNSVSTETLRQFHEHFAKILKRRK